MSSASVKDTLRQTYKRIRQDLPQEHQRSASHQIAARIYELDIYTQSEHIALYCALNGEVDLYPVWKNALFQGKKCYFPVLNADRTLSFLPATEATAFTSNQFNIAEPAVDLECAIELEQLDIIFMPLVAFDEKGTRLGRGGGYYDRTLCHNKLSTLIGIAYEFQRIDTIEAEPWDVPLDIIVTDKTVYWSAS